MFYLHVYVCIVHILCMKMHYYLLLNIKYGASQLYLGAQIQLWGPGGGSGGGAFLRPGRGACDRPSEGLQLYSAGTGQDIFARKCVYEKTTKFPNFTWYPPNNKIIEFYRIFARKWPTFTWHSPENVRIFHDTCPKNIFPEIGRGGTCPPCPRLLLLR